MYHAPPLSPTHVVYDELPAYTKRVRRPRRAVETPEPAKTDHTFHLLGSKTNKPWATLKVNSSARHGQHIPTFFEDEPIVGCVDLDLEKEDAIQTVTVTVRGIFNSVFEFWLIGGDDDDDRSRAG
jgi:hypothetical protein